MITKNKTHDPRIIHRLYLHNSGVEINYYEGHYHKFQCCYERALQLGYGYGATPLEALEDAIRGLKKFNKNALIRELENFAEELKTLPEADEEECLDGADLQGAKELPKKLDNKE